MKEAIYAYLHECPPALELFRKLEQSGNIYLIGGVLREYQDHKKIQRLRDIDIIVDVKNRAVWEETMTRYSVQRNRFDGYKLRCKDLLMDTWAIEDTWAFRSKTIRCRKEDYLRYLPKTVFLNIDAIIYDWEEGRWIDQAYQNAMKTRTLDVVLEENPYLFLNTVRTLILKRRYQMALSGKLRKIMLSGMKEPKDLPQYVDMLYNEQVRRYQPAILSRDLIYDEICSLMREKG